VFSARKEILVVLGVLTLLLVMPIAAIISVTNVGALSSSLSSNDVTLYDGRNYPGDLYDFGNCTYWISLRRSRIGRPIPNSWGNAATWAIRSVLDGYYVDHTPTQYAIMQTPNAAGGLGHVAFVEKVDPDGVWHISEMNVRGFDEIDDQSMLPSVALNYNFIHFLGSK
jgi:peptidoglycan endopeptidase LytE